MVLTHWHIGSVTICWTVYDCKYLPPYTGQCCWHSEGAPFVAYTSVEQNIQVFLCENVCKTLETVAYINTMYNIHCIYVSVTKPTYPAFSAWLNTGSIRPLKVTGKAIMLCSMALPWKLCAALHGQSNVGSMCNCKPCRSLDLTVLVEILSGVDRSQEERQCQLKVNIMSNRKKDMLTKDVPLSSHLADYVL